MIPGKYVKKHGNQRPRNRFRMMENDKKTKSWLVIIIGDRKRHGPFKVTKRSLVLLSICFIATLFAAIACSLWLYSKPCTVSTNKLAGELAIARQRTDLISQEKDELSEEAEILRAEIKTLHKKQKIRATVEKKKESKPIIAKSDNDTKGELFVSIEEIKTIYDKNNKTFKVRFIIRSQDADGDYISGYAFVILNPAPGSSSPCKIYPNTSLVNGLPETYKQGEYFYIARFKHMEGVFTPISGKSRYGSVSILIYAKDGTLRLKKELSL